MCRSLLAVAGVIITASVLTVSCSSDDKQDGAALLVADHTSLASFSKIPSQYLDAAKQFRIFYGHTSHGSQIVTGIEMLASESGTYQYPSTMLSEPGGDLGTNGDLAWEATTRAQLASADNDRSVVMWSWCGGVSGNTQEGIQTYLNAMSKLEADFPKIKFIYMTGHTDGTGATGNLRVRNKQIRDWCLANNKVLFDFEDIESWDPAGNYYPDIADDCAWCSNWCTSNSCPSCGGCAHSHCFNCYQKGKAFWWMMARLAGWNGA